MTWLPQSLFSRLLAALVAVIGVTLMVITLLIVRERRDLALWGSTAWNAAAVIAETSEKLASLGPEERRTALDQYRAEPIEIESTRRGPPPQRTNAIQQSEEAFARRLRRQLDDDYKVSVNRRAPRFGEPIRIIEESRRTSPSDGDERASGDSPPDRPPVSMGPSAGSPAVALQKGGNRQPDFGSRMPDGYRPGDERPRRQRGSRLFDVTVQLPDGEQVVFRTNAPLPGPPLPRQIFTELGALTVALAVVLFLMTRNITQPLSELARAADAIGKGATVPALRERGARELRDATRAFNTMQDRLHRYLDSRTRVLAAMSHDLRTPLTRLRLRAETIEDAVTRERITADIDEMSVMVTGALSLFRGLNDSEGTIPVLIDAILSSLQQEFAELGGEVEISGRSSGPIVAKPNAIKRCLSNLLHNAVKYGHRARVTISDGATLRIRICDEGPGIPEDQLGQVFEPFYRLESSRNRDSGGTGLGLCIARDIVEAHGGSIQLANLPNGGLEAMVNLPRAK